MDQNGEGNDLRFNEIKEIVWSGMKNNVRKVLNDWVKKKHFKSLKFFLICIKKYI